MGRKLLAERTREMIPRYEEHFRTRGGVTPSDPLEFHLYHLARYWSRLVGFCRQLPEKPEACIDGDLGACVAVGSQFADKLIGPTAPVHKLWRDYWELVQTILHRRPVTLAEVEEASRAFEACLAALAYDPWGSKQGRRTD